jgi:hypothetical protein
MRFGFDIGGVLSKYPRQFRELIERLRDRGHGNEIYVISDMHPKEKLVLLMQYNKIPVWEQNLYCADFDKYGEGCKAELLHELKIDIFFDDHMSYCAASFPGAYPTIRCLVWPDASKPYTADDWIVPQEWPSFGRVSYRRDS